MFTRVLNKPLKLSISVLALLAATTFSWHFKDKILLKKNKWLAERSLTKSISGPSIRSGLYLGHVALPPALQNLPLADILGIVLKSHTINVDGIRSLSNGSIIAHEKGFGLVFTYPFTDDLGILRARIGYTLLNEELQEVGSFRPIDLPNISPEDARIVKVANQHFLTFNDAINTNYKLRQMYVAPINISNGQVPYVTPLHFKFEGVEKNWAPFDFDNQLHLSYSISPHQVLQMAQPRINFLAPLEPQEIKDWEWPHLWGEIRGGTPAIKIGDQYLAFFHSSFRLKEKCVDANKRYHWYVMGAYTFEAHPPFRITAVSPYPLLFDGLYSSPKKTERPELHCIFPAGIAVVKKDDRDLIYLSCGENDECTKVVVLDKEALLQSLRPVKYK